MMATATSRERRLWTEEELQALPDDGFKHEVVGGELVMSPKNNFQHENICAGLLVVLRTFANARRLGVVLGSSAGYWMHNRNCRAPDISFITKARLGSLGFRPNSKRFFPGAPDLAVEVLSPGNTHAEIEARLQDFFQSGTQIAWLIHPDRELVEVCYSLEKRRLVEIGQELDGEHLLPGFRHPVAALFKEWDWE